MTTTLAEVEILVKGDLGPWKASQQEALREAEALSTSLMKAGEEIKLKVNTTSIKKAMAETEALKASMTKTAAANAAASQAFFNRMATGSKAAGKELVLNNQQLMNMQFQMNDMAVMLASGQNPFVMIMQQGMQIGQIFGPGATVSQALRATGQGILTFLTNPINLAIAGTAVLAGGIPLVWRAMTGSGAAEAEDTLKRFDEWLGELEKGYEDAADAARAFTDVIRTQDEITARTNRVQEELAASLVDAIEEIAESATNIFTGFQNPILREKMTEIQDMGIALSKGEMTADEFQKRMTEIRLDEDATPELRSFTDELSDAADEAARLERAIKGASAAAMEISLEDFPDIPIETNFRTPDDEFGRTLIALQDARREQQREQERLEKEAEREERRASRAADRAAKEAARYNDQRTRNQNVIADLRTEILALNQSTDARKQIMDQLREEQQIRRAIAALGDNANQAEISAIKELIPIKNDLLEQEREELMLLRQKTQQYGTMGNAAGSALSGILSGSISAEEAAKRIALQWAQMILQAQILESFGNGAGGLTPTGNFMNQLIGSFFSGFRASGGSVEAGKAYIVGEDGPEPFIPNQSGIILPNSSLGQLSGGGGGNKVTNIFSPTLNAPNANKSELAALRRQLVISDRTFKRRVAGANNEFEGGRNT